MERVSRCWSAAYTAFSRTKTVDIQLLHNTELKRCLDVVDLIALGVGSTLGTGLYVLTAQVAKTQAGPAVVISFIIAAVATFLAALCYAEFATRVPKAGSAYIYSYVSVGELWAFTIGWNMLLENIIGAASTGKAWSEYFDSLINGTIRRSIESQIGNITVPPGFDPYPDVLAMSLLLLVTLLVSIGVKISATVNLVFTAINLAIIVCIIAIGVFYADVTNWTQSPGGFFPFGFTGVISGAATCFYAFVGFDIISISGEESSKPTKHVPVAIVSTLGICLSAYVGVSSVLTLLVPWDRLADTAALPNAFTQVGVSGAKYVIVVGGLCGLMASIMGSIFPLPRGLYAMAQDGLVFRFLGSVNQWTNTPFLATWICGFLVALSAVIFDLDALVQMMSIGTLMAYTLVAVSVLVQHYQREQVGLTASDHGPGCDVTPSPHNGASCQLERKPSDAPGGPAVRGARLSVSEDTGLLRVGDASKRVRYVPAKTTTVVKRIKPPTDSDDEQAPAESVTSSEPPPPTPPSVVEAYRAKVNSERQQQREQQQQPHLTVESDNSYRRADSDYSIDNLSQLFNAGDDATPRPTARTKRIVMMSLLVLVIIWTAECVLMVYGWNTLRAGDWWAVTITVCCLVCVLGLCVVIGRQPRNTTELHFSTPLVPWIPLASVLFNIFLMISLSPLTWIRFAVWMTFGMVIYLGYGVWHSSERRSEDTQTTLHDKDSMNDDGVYQ